MLKYHPIEKPQKWGEKFLGSILKQKSPFHNIVSRLLWDITKTFFLYLGASEMCRRFIFLGIF
jgi:hypothetical protein